MARFQTRTIAAARRLRRQIVQLVPGTGALVRPTFIIGCGRSGTTAVGELLDRHPALAYLHEPRDIWQLDPRTDVWSARAGERGGRLVLDAHDADAATSSRLTRAFAAEVRVRRAERLVEKLPLNSFRIGYIDALFPDARFVHVVRHGVEVARSIAKLSALGVWFGHADYKWRLLADLAREGGDGARLDLCTTDELRGLLEWRLSVLAARRALARLPVERWMEVRYEALVDDPTSVCQQLEAFLGIPPDDAMRHFASARLQRRSAEVDPVTLSSPARAIAGDLLVELGHLDRDRPPSDL